MSQRHGRAAIAAWIGSSAILCGRNPSGNVIWFAPGEKHWHGSSPTTAMQHIGIQESLGGKEVDWTEKVTDEQYHR